jgi:hypothetical protein
LLCSQLQYLAAAAQRDTLDRHQILDHYWHAGKKAISMYQRGFRQPGENMQSGIFFCAFKRRGGVGRTRLVGRIPVRDNTIRRLNGNRRRVICRAGRQRLRAKVSKFRTIDFQAFEPCIYPLDMAVTDPIGIANQCLLQITHKYSKKVRRWKGPSLRNGPDAILIWLAFGVY